jgi:Putative Actinobacterial Holin-X, holin superfamily III
MTKGSQHNSGTSFTSLVGDLASDANELLRQEVALTKLEVQYELRKAKTAAMALGVGIGVAILGGMLLMLMVVHLLAALTVVPLWGCYGIVGSGLVVLGGVWLAVAKATANKLGVVAAGTAERINESVQWLTQQTRSDRRSTRAVKISPTPVRP